MTASTQDRFDAVVVGAGLGGLSTALHLQQQGLRVAVVEQAGRVGGLCGTHWINGREYVIACNDFGTAMPRWLAEAGVTVPFQRYCTRICYEGKIFTLPPKAGSILKLLPHVGDVVRYARTLKAERRSGYARYQSLAALVDARIRSPMVADLLKLPGYLMGVSPEQLRLDALNDEFEFGYGYVQPMTPDGGPQVLADAMAAKVSERGAVLLDTRYLGHDAHPDDGKRIRTSRGDLHARFLINATSDESVYPETFPRGLPLAMYCLAIDRRFHYPDGVHTCVHYPPKISEWFPALEDGRLPREFGFHVFKSDLPSAGDAYTMNLYFYLPRGQETPSTSVRAAVERYVFDRLEAMLPGIGQAIRERHLIAPDEFTARHAMSSRVLPVVTPVGFAKPANYCATSDTYRAGAAYYPPGDHGSAAMLSGRHVAALIERARANAAARMEASEVA